MPAKAFISYSHADDTYRARLDQHLSPLTRSGLVSVWHDRRLGPGEDWGGRIHAHLAEADIILCLLSCAFFASDYCWCDEMKMALDRHDAGSAVLVPIVCRPCDWEFLRLGRIQALPPNGVAISNWPNRDKAFESVARGIRQLVSERFLGGCKPATGDRRITVRIVLDTDDPSALAKLSKAEVLASVHSYLRKVTEDDHLAIKGVSSGSIVVDIECTEKAFNVFNLAARHGDLFGDYGCSIREIFCPIVDETPYFYRSPLGGIYAGYGDESEGSGTMYCARSSFAGLEMLAALGRSLLPDNVATIEQCAVLVTRRGRVFYAQTNLKQAGLDSAPKILTNTLRGLRDMLKQLVSPKGIAGTYRVARAHRASVQYLIDEELVPLIEDGRLDLQGASRVRYVDLQVVAEQMGSGSAA